MSAEPDVVMRLAFEAASAFSESCAARMACEEASRLYIEAETKQRRAMDSMELARHTLMYYAERGKMPMPGATHANFMFPEK